MLPNSEVVLDTVVVAVIILPAGIAEVNVIMKSNLLVVSVFPSTSLYVEDAALLSAPDPSVADPINICPSP